MKKILLVVILVGLGCFSGEARAEILNVCPTASGTGFLERTDQGDLVLHLSGSYYDMGWQHGKLLADDARLAVRSAEFMLWLHRPYLPAAVTVRLIYSRVSSLSRAYIPPEFMEELQGLADASGFPLETVLALHSIGYLTSCSTAAAWARASADGELYFARSNDIEAAIDPMTGRSYHERGMIVIYQPRDGIPYLMFTWPGFLGASDGMNARGIAIGNMSLPSQYETPAGVPMCFRIKQALARASSLEEAVEWMTQAPLEGGYNFIVADAKLPEARVLEMDARSVYLGAWDGPAESNHYTFQGRDYAYSPLPDLILRTNHPLSSELIAHRVQVMDDGSPHSRLTFQRYSDLRRRLELAHGSITLESLMELWREHYRSIQWEKGPSLGIVSHQIAFAPKSGDFLIAVCHGNPFKIGLRRASAFSQPYHRYNFFTLMAERPE